MITAENLDHAWNHRSADEPGPSEELVKAVMESEAFYKILDGFKKKAFRKRRRTFSLGIVMAFGLKLGHEMAKTTELEKMVKVE